MRVILLLIILQALSLNSAYAGDSTAKRLGAELGVGFQSNYGLIGAGGKYFLSENLDVHLNAGLDLNGFLVAFGSRYYLQSSSKTCLFIFDCKANYFVGGTLLRTNGTTATVEGEGVKGEYKKSDGYAANIAFGTYDIFGDSFTLGLELGYRLWFRRPEVKFQSGTFLQKHKDNLVGYSENSISAAITFGWLF